MRATIEASLPTPMPMQTPTALPTSTPHGPCQLRRGCWIETGMGSLAEVTVQGFSDNPSIFHMLLQIIDEEERLLDVAFPAPRIRVTRVHSMPGGFCGQNQYSQQYAYPGNEATVESSNITIRVDGECDDTFGIIAHEVAHTWFQGEHPWMDEGLADSIEYQIRENHPEEGPIYLPVTYCATHQNISELERANPSITTTVQGGMPGDARRAARRFAWERLAPSLRSCVSSSHRSSSKGPNRSRGSISRTTRYTCGRVIRGIFFPPSLLQTQEKSSAQQA